MSGPATFPLSKIAIIGPGLIGGAILWACHHRKLAPTLAAFEPHADAHSHLRASIPGLTLAPSAPEAIRNADLVFLCLPIDRMQSVVEEILPALAPNAVVTDVGSVKGPVVAALTPLLGKRWIGGHPMAGREKGGFDAAASATLFEGKTIVLTPTPETGPVTLSLVTAFWEALGGKISFLTPEEHDRRTARISHLPHLAAAALAAIVDGESLRIAGPGFKDTTRIAAGPAAMWREILLANRAEVGSILDTFIAELQQARQALSEGKGEELQALLEKANDTRRKLE